MTQHDVLELFRKESAMLGRVEASQSNIILQLAQLLADSKECLSKESFDAFVHVGAVMYQEGLGQFNARSEMAGIMKKSAEDRKKPK